MTPLTRFNAAVIGLGVGEKHLESFVNHPDCNTCYALDIDPDKTRTLSKKYASVEFVSSEKALFERDDIDILSIAGYDDTHYGHICAAIEKGINTFVEKPLCMRREELDHIYDLLMQNPNVAMSTNLILRKSPRFKDLKNRVQNGELGQLYYLEGDYNYGRLSKIVSGWRGQLPYYSALLGGAIHVLDLVLWLHPCSVAEVTSMGNNIASRGTAFRYNDFATSLIRFEDDTIARVSANFACVYPHFHKLNVYGTEASFENRQGPALLWKSRDPDHEPEKLDTDYPGVHKGDLLLEFIEELQGGSAESIPDNEIFNTMNVCLAMEESMLAGRTVSVNNRYIR